MRLPTERVERYFAWLTYGRLRLIDGLRKSVTVTQANIMIRSDGAPRTTQTVDLSGRRSAPGRQVAPNRR